MLPTAATAATGPALRTQQIDLLYSTLPFSLASSLGLATLTTVPLWTVVSHLNVALWLGAHLVLTFARILVWRSWKRGSAEGPHGTFLFTTFRVTASLAGAIWGALAVTCYPAELSHQVFIAFVIAGVSASAVTSLSTDRLSAQVFSTLCVLPIAFQLLSAPDSLSRSMGIMIVAYLGFLSFSIQRSGKQILDTIRLRLWSDELQRAASLQYMQLRTVLDSATRVAIIATDLDGIVQVFNSGAELMLGYRAEELIGKHSVMLWHLPSEIESRAQERAKATGMNATGFAALAQQSASGKPDEGRWTFVRSDGSQLTVNLIVSGARNERGDLVGFIGIATDITAQLRAEEEAATTRSQLEAFVEHIPAAVAMFDKELRYLAFSRRWLTDFDLGTQRLQGRLYGEVIPEMARDWSTTLHRCLAGAVERREEDALHHPDGSVQWLEWEARPWFDSRGQIGGVIMIVEDITTRRMTSDALRASTELLRKLTDRVPGVIYKYRHGSPAVREFRFISAGASATLGIDPAAMMHDVATFFACIHPDDVAIKSAQLSAAAATNAVRACEYRVLAKAGELRWVHDEAVGEIENGTELMFYGHITDITERKAAEDDRARLAERMELATHAGGIGVWEFDVVGHALQWDRRMFEVHGIPSESRDITWSDWLELIEPSDRVRVESALLPAAATSFDAEYRIASPATSIRHIKMSAHVERDAQARPLRLIGVSWDVTELKRVERMKSEFVSTVSHELRTPLTSIRGSLGLLVGGALNRDPERAHAMIKLAARNADRLALLIDDLLDLEKMEAGKMRFEITQVDVATAIRQSIESNDGLAQRYEVRFKFDTHESPSYAVNADPYRLQQVLSNFLSNAAKFSPPGSDVQIAVATDAHRVRVAVIDQGGGVPAEFRPRLFEKFSQADSSDARSKGGTGLGLAVCKAIIDTLGGHIGYEDTQPHGATFFFELPIADRGY